MNKEDVMQVNFRIYGKENIEKFLRVKKAIKKYARKNNTSYSRILSDFFINFEEYVTDHLPQTIDKVKNRGSYIMGFQESSIYKMFEENFMPRIMGIIKNAELNNQIYLKILNYKLNFLFRSLDDANIISMPSIIENLHEYVDDQVWMNDLMAEEKEKVYKIEAGYIDDEDKK